MADQAGGDPQNDKDKGQGDETNLQWLPARLERERRTLLKELGFESPEDAKKAADDAKKRADEAKTDAEKSAERLRELDRLKSDNAFMADTIRGRLESELGALTPEQAAAVRKLAPGDDPASMQADHITAQLRAIDVLKPTWAAPTGDKKQGDDKKTETKPDTAPGKSAPNDTGNNLSPTDHRAQYYELRKSNPVKAAWYLRQHQNEIFPRH